MYTSHFNLKMLPFENVPDPAFFFDEGDHSRIHNHVRESIKAGRGLTVVSGPIGSGKTTLSQMIISELSNNLKLIWMAEPPGNSMDLFLFIAQELGLNPSSPERVFVIRDIKDTLSRIVSNGSTCLMIIDESHLMTDDTLNGVRMLNNLEEGSTKLIQILLLGQEELIDTINRPEMEAFKQRIATMEIMGKMDSNGIRKYISHRIHVAGGRQSIFDDTGWEALMLAFGSGNTPRIINLLSDRSLNAAFEREKTAVDVDDVYKAAEGMGLQKEVFFYKIALKEKGKRDPSTEKSVSDKKPAAPGKAPIILDNNRTDRTVTAHKHKEAENKSEISGIDQKNLKKPVLLLLLSIATFIVSISFYCSQSGQTDLMSCLEKLLIF